MTAFNKQMETLPTTSEFQDMDLYLQIINADHLRLPLFCIMYMYLISLLVRWEEGRMGIFLKKFSLFYQFKQVSWMMYL